MSKVTIKYENKFHTDWHCGSGLAAGAGVDALTVKDKNGLPFIPGKAIKDLVREAVEEILFIGGKGEMANDKRDLFKQTFGNSKDRNIIKEEQQPKDENKKADSYKETHKGETFFTNAMLKEDEVNAIIENTAVRFMYRSVANTAIDETGIAVENSLRKTEVAVPCKCYGEILDVPVAFEKEICEALKYIKRLGQGRNRGLGRCTIEITEIEKGG